jgi:hypothetical protein
MNILCTRRDLGVAKTLHTPQSRHCYILFSVAGLGICNSECNVMYSAMVLCVATNSRYT